MMFVLRHVKSIQIIHAGSVTGQDHPLLSHGQFLVQLLVPEDTMIKDARSKIKASVVN